MSKIKSILFVFLIAVLFYTRLAGINWGLPYPFHPDERNMAVAIQSLNCEISNFKFQISNCLNPHFFAYGQFPLYLGYFGIQVSHLVTGRIYQPITFEEAVLSLRLIAVFASFFTVIVGLAIVRLVKLVKLDKLEKSMVLITSLAFIFSPALIQSSHFGTTESLLTFLYSTIIYLSLRLLDESKKVNLLSLIGLALVTGCAIATKVSSLVFVPVPILALLLRKNSLINKTILVIRFMAYTAIFSIIFSPHNLISLPDFLSTINYESGVALGKMLVFYTRQFVGTVPVIFQITKIFPYALGWPVFILGVLGFFALSWRNNKINLLRFAFLVYFIPNAYFFAKWTRFMVPVFPVMLIFAILILSKFLFFNFPTSLKLRGARKFLNNFKFNSNFKFIISNLSKAIIILILIIPGLAYLSIYQNQDVRLQASDWIYKNIKENSNILSETANVVDIPIPNPKSPASPAKRGEQIPNPNYNVVSFNFYDLDIDPILQTDFKNYLSNADYIFVPSRRLFKNHDAKNYPILNNYYQKLFSGELGFKKVAEFNSFPSFTFYVSRFTFHLDFPDENAEETWSVFDHPVVRIYKRV